MSLPSIVEVLIALPYVTLNVYDEVHATCGLAIRLAVGAKASSVRDSRCSTEELAHRRGMAGARLRRDEARATTARAAAAARRCAGDSCWDTGTPACKRGPTTERGRPG